MGFAMGSRVWRPISGNAGNLALRVNGTEVAATSAAFFQSKEAQ